MVLEIDIPVAKISEADVPVIREAEVEGISLSAVEAKIKARNTLYAEALEEGLNVHIDPYEGVTIGSGSVKVNP